MEYYLIASNMAKEKKIIGHWNSCDQNVQAHDDLNDSWFLVKWIISVSSHALFY